MRILFSFLLVFVFVACSSTSKKTLKNYTTYLQDKDYKTALELAESKKFYKDKESLLLKKIEIGTLQFLQSDFSASLKNFEEARELSNSLYTKSISKKAKAYLGNDSSDNYYGEIYERSLVRYYLILNHLSLYQAETFNVKAGEKVEERKMDSKTRRFHFQAARSIAAEWYSKNEAWRNKLNKKSVFKDDLLSKLVGARVHEIQNRSGERQIAINLLGEGQKVLDRNYSGYRPFNTRSKKFRKNFYRFKKLSSKDIKSKYIDPTKESKELKSFISKSKRRVQRNKKNNVYFVFEEGLIGSKTAKKFFFPLEIATRLGSIATGQLAVTDFVVRVLGMASENGKPGISFELPELKIKNQYRDLTFIIKKDGKKVKKFKPYLVNPMSDIAKEALEENALALKVRLGTRLAVKYTSAIISAIGAYKAAKSNGAPKLAAELAASSLFALSIKGIEYSEEADLRNWRSLPANIYSTSFQLTPGDYELFYQDDNDKKSGQSKLESFKVTKDRTRLIHSRI